MNILFVCTGNTCRSPMAEGYLSSKNMPWITVISRGIFADGSPVSRNTAEVMKEVGTDISSHISRLLTKDDTEWADKIICMSNSHLEQLKAGGVPLKKLIVLGGGISDPFGGSTDVYRKCRDEIFACIDRLFEDGFFSDFKISPINQSHIAAVAKLESVCFSEPWSADGILDSYKHGTRFFIAENGNHIMGYIGIKPVADEGYITNVAVFPKYRRMGVATALLGKVFSFARENGLCFVSLEVRKSNNAAVQLYKNNGFICEGVRRDFYRSPKEDALIMTKRFEK